VRSVKRDRVARGGIKLALQGEPVGAQAQEV
jgi:hypothetical protein